MIWGRKLKKSVEALSRVGKALIIIVAIILCLAAFVYFPHDTLSNKISLGVAFALVIILSAVAMFLLNFSLNIAGCLFEINKNTENATKYLEALVHSNDRVVCLTKGAVKDLKDDESED